MGEMRDSDWSRENLLRSDWLLLIGAIMTTNCSGEEIGLILNREANRLSQDARLYFTSAPDYLNFLGKKYFDSLFQDFCHRPLYGNSRLLQ